MRKAGPILVVILSFMMPARQAASQAPPPRLDRVSVFGTTFSPGSTVSTWLYVQGANIDTNAEVLVNGQVQPTAPHRAIRNELYGIPAATLAYPIHMYRALVVAPGVRRAGEAITLAVRNPDGQISDTASYTLPADSATLDSDGDDIPDLWETQGYDADGDGTVDVDLSRLGAHPHRPDVLLEVDVMEGLVHRPTAAVFTAVRDAFASAPILNPRGDNGVNLIVDATGTVPLVPDLDFGNDPAGTGNFYVLKGNHFDERRGRLYHYCIWGKSRRNRASGQSDVAFDPNSTSLDGPGDDCMVTFDDFPPRFQTVRIGASTLMHELGHNLMQRHGGTSHFQFSPPYSSVMSYSWQMRTGEAPRMRLARPVCVPLFYAAAGATERQGALPATVGDVIDYSEGMGRTLAEDSLDEREGVCNATPVDWNFDGRIGPNRVSVDIDRDGVAQSTFRDYANWRHLNFTGPRLNGRFGR